MKGIKVFLIVLGLVMVGGVVQAQYYSLLPTPLCWNTNGVDSSVIAVRFFIAGNNNTQPVGTTGYWDLYGNSVTISNGTLSSGFCCQDTLIMAPVLPSDCKVTRDLDHFDITSGTTTFNANTYYGVTITVISGTASVTVNGKTFVYPAGYTGTFNSPHQCEYLKDSIIVNISSGRAIVLTIQ